jgi:ribosomal protein S18 acetylase RimI-like enzyme
MYVRAGVPADAGDLVAVGRAAGLRDGADDFLAQLADPGIALYVADDRDTVVGFIALRTATPPECVQARTPIQLWRLYVAPEFHGQGVARALTGRALVHAHAKGHDVVWLGTEPGNARAIAFYGKCGFRRAGSANLHGDGAEHADAILACLLGTDG